MAYELRTILIVFVLGSLLSFGLFSFYADVSTHYYFEKDERFEHSLNKINESYSLFTYIKDDTLNGTISGTDQEGSIFTRSLQSIKTFAKGTSAIKSIPEIFFVISSEIASFLKIPQIVVYALYTVLGIIILFAIISAVLRNPV